MNLKKPPQNGSGRTALLRWELAAVGLAMLVLVAVALLPERQAEMGPGRLVVYGSLILLGALLVALWVMRGRTLARQLQTAETDLKEIRERMAAIFRLSHRFALAQDEAAVIDIVLQMCIDVVHVAGASFVPLDNRSQPLPAVMIGDFSGTGVEDWAEYMVSAHTREACAACRDHQANHPDPCPLLSDLPLTQIAGVFCFPLRRGDRDYGMLNIYLSEGKSMEHEALAFLSAMLDEMAIAIEALRLRERESAASHSLEAVQKTKRDDLLRAMAESLNRAINASYTHLCVHKNELSARDLELTVGDPPSRIHRYLESQAVAAQEAGNGVPSPEENLPVGVTALFVCPLTLPDDTLIGNLVLAKATGKEFSKSSMQIAQTVADQIALTARYSQMVQAVEYRAVMDERARLAREIHDGIAQTLGFLKLLTAQLENNLARGETARINQLMDLSRATLADAYVDARQAIDGLRISPINGFGSWVQQAAEDFSENNSLSVAVDTEQFPAAVPPEVQAQLIRIVQEALTNIRKHAGAQQVWIQSGDWQGDLVLEIRDNGVGFEPEDIIRPSRHGLRGMQERAELIEAEFQVISSPGSGTTVRVRLPGSEVELAS